MSRIARDHPPADPPHLHKNRQPLSWLQQRSAFRSTEAPIGRRTSVGWAANRLAALLTVAALLAGAATYAALTEAPALGQDADTVTLLLTLDLVLLLALGGVVARRVTHLWAERRQGLAGSRLHVRLVALFSLLAMVPTILVAVFSSVFLYVGLESWFSDRVRTAINESLAVAQAYLHEHQQAIRADVLAMANDLNRGMAQFLPDPRLFNDIVLYQAATRGLTEAVVFDGSGRIVARAGLTFFLDIDPIPEEIVEQARRGEVVTLTNDQDDRVRALIRLDGFVDTFLFVGRLVEPRVLMHMERVQGVAREYAEIAQIRSKVQITSTAIFIIVALLILFAAVWLGLLIANQIVTPISQLIGAAEQVRAGDLSARVLEGASGDEIAVLSRAFNRMTDQLETQRDHLVDANRQLDQRRRFTEAVLSGVSAGVMGLDKEGRIHLPNRSAADLLGIDDLSQLSGRMAVEILPDLAEPLASALRRPPGRPTETQLQFRRPGQERTLLVRISAEAIIHGEAGGFVVTFDDVTELQSAQRKAAWADVAQRIAHEIKNPLTPIQLSAERLKRKYLKEISSDPQTFLMCTDTIVRQVDEIGRMVDEFSAFARMPQAVMRPLDLCGLIQQTVFLLSSAHPDTHIEPLLPQAPLMVVCDGRQIQRALTNLLKNAAEAIEGRGNKSSSKGKITIRMILGTGGVTIAVEDNGRGLPESGRDRLTEPYVTTRTKGTGLGLAIVAKIMEDHGGRLTLCDHEGGGAIVTLLIPTGIPPSHPEISTSYQVVTHGT